MARRRGKKCKGIPPCIVAIGFGVALILGIKYLAPPQGAGATAFCCPPL